MSFVLICVFSFLQRQQIKFGHKVNFQIDELQRRRQDDKEVEKEIEFSCSQELGQDTFGSRLQHGVFAQGSEKTELQAVRVPG